MAQLAVRGGKAVRSKPFPRWPQGGPEEISWLQRVLSSGRWFAGARGDDPESLGAILGERFAKLHGIRFGLPVANGSVAIEIALRALGIGRGDDVIVPAYTFVSTATSVLMLGAVPVFADIDPLSYCLDPKDVALRIGPRTRAILPVHLGGQMADMGEMLTLAQRHGLAVVEDCAQAIGAAWQGRRAGAWGSLGTFSFQANKTITAGEGGMVLTSDPTLAENVAAFRAFGRFRENGPTKARSSALASQRLSSNYRLSEFQAGVLLAQLEKFPGQDARRQANAARLTEGLPKIPGLRHVRVDAPSTKHAYYYYLIRYASEMFGNVGPERLCEALNAEGIPFVPGDAHPIYDHPVFKPENLAEALCPEVMERFRKAADLAHTQCPAAEDACRCTLILRHQVLLAEPEDMDDILEALRKVQQNIDELQ